MSVWKKHDFLVDAAAAGNGTEYVLSGNYDNVYVYLEIVGTTSDAVLVFEAAGALGEYSAVLGYNRASTSTATGTSSPTVEKWEIELNGYTKFRVRVDSASAGTVSVSGILVDEDG